MLHYNQAVLILLCHNFSRPLHNKLCRFFSKSSYLSFFFAKHPDALWPFFTQLRYSPLNSISLVVPFFQNSTALWQYLTQLFHITLKKLVLVLLFNLYSMLKLYLLLLLMIYAFHQAHYSITKKAFLIYFYAILEMFMLQDTRISLYYSVRV